jgi:cytochrome c oxidase subunit III
LFISINTSANSGIQRTDKMNGDLSVQTDRLAINRLGLWLFFLSESFLFIALLVTRFYLLGMSRPAEVNQPLGFAISIILLLSSLTAYRAEIFIAHGMEKLFRRNIIFSLCLGSLFLLGVGIEWSQAFHSFPPNTVFGTVFFTMTGFHAFHVLLGLIALLVLVLPGQRGRFTPENYWGAEGIIKFWHFIDLMWIFIFPTLYLIS